MEAHALCIAIDVIERIFIRLGTYLLLLLIGVIGEGYGLIYLSEINVSYTCINHKCSAFKEVNQIGPLKR